MAKAKSKSDQSTPGTRVTGKATKKKASKKIATKKKAAKKKTKRRTTKKKATQKKATKKKATKKKATKKKATKKKVTKKKVTKKKVTKKKVTKKKVTKKKVRRAAAARTSTRGIDTKRLTLAEQMFYAEQDEFVAPTVAFSRARRSVDIIASPAQLRKEFHARREELKEQYESAQQILQDHVLPQIQDGAYGDVTGYYVSFRTKYNKIVSPLSYCIVISVASKLRESTLERRSLVCLPKSIEGVPVKVIESNLVKGRKTSNTEMADVVMPQGGFQSENLVELADHTHPLAESTLIGGLPVEERLVDGSEGSAGSGTWGVAYKSRRTYFGFVNAHFALNVQSTMVQPPAVCDDTNWSFGEVIRRFEGTQPGGFAHVDAALIKVKTDRQMSLSVIDFNDEPIFFANRPLENDDSLMRVSKFGARTLERREGFIHVPNASGKLIDGVPIGDVIVAESDSGAAFSMLGDSGSILIAQVRRRNGAIIHLAVGICFALDESQPKWLYACHMKSVIDALEIDLPDRLLIDDWTTV